VPTVVLLVDAAKVNEERELERAATGDRPSSSSSCANVVVAGVLDRT